MYTTTVNYKNLDGVDVKEELMFSLSTIEVARLGAKYSQNGGDLIEHIQKVSASQDWYANINMLADLALDGFGQRSADGSRFIKTPEVRTNFEHSLAFAEFIEKLITDPEEAQRFGSGLINVDKVLSKMAPEKVDALKLVERGKTSDDVLRNTVQDSVVTTTPKGTIDMEAEFKAFLESRKDV